MCGRYYIDEEMASELEQLVQDLDQKRMKIDKKTDVMPSMQAPILFGQERHRSMCLSAWGFSKYKTNGLIINARAETAAQKPLFRDSLNSRRCIIPARGFYEWDSDKNKFQFSYDNGNIMYMAGLFHYEKEERAFVILTTSANRSMEPVHDRMPLILKEHMIESWLFDDSATEMILNTVPPVLKRYSEMEQMRLEF